MLPLNPDARLYYRVGKRRLAEAKLISEKLKLWSAAHYLGGYAAECMFKALLISATPASERPASGDATVEWLKAEHGHSLGSWRRAVASRGVRLPDSLAGEFVFVSTWDPEMRYRPGHGDARPTQRFLAAVEKLVKWADERM